MWKCLGFGGSALGLLQHLPHAQLLIETGAIGDDCRG